MSQQLLDELGKGLYSMGLAVPAAVPQQLVDYLGLLIHWSRAYNLTAVREPLEMVSKHLLDSLAVLPFIDGSQVADIASGTGLPGTPLALSLPGTKFVLIDSNGKKTRFLNQARMVLDLDNVASRRSC